MANLAMQPFNFIYHIIGDGYGDGDGDVDKAGDGGGGDGDGNGDGNGDGEGDGESESTTCAVQSVGRMSASCFSLISHPISIIVRPTLVGCWFSIFT